MLRIAESVFNELYPDLIGQYDFFNSPPPLGISDVYFERTYLKSKLWRLNNLYKIIDKAGNPVTFRMNYAQHKVYSTARKHPRLIILKSRQQGISTLWLISYFDDAIFCPYLNLGLMAQGQEEASTLLERVKFTWDNLDPMVKNFLGIKIKRDNSKEVAFSNNSTMFIRVSFRSATLQRLHVSEFGKIANAYPQRAKEVKTGTLQALGRGNTGVIESTAEGNNAFKRMWDESITALSLDQMTYKDFYPVFLPWHKDPDCWMDVPQTITEEAAQYFNELEKEHGIVLVDEQKWFWVAQYRELGGDIFQEYPATPEEAFTASKDGTYWSRSYVEHVIKKQRMVKDLYDPNLPVDVYADLGIDDYMVLLFVQWYRGEYRIIDEYFNCGYAIQHYVDEAEKRYTIRNYCMPHDIARREHSVGDGAHRAKSRKKIMAEYLESIGSKANIRVLPRADKADSIEAVRRIIPRMRIDAKCEYIHNCFLNYTKEWDEKLGVWKQTPKHDEYSHGADTIAAFAGHASESDSEWHSPDDMQYLQEHNNVSQNDGFAI